MSASDFTIQRGYLTAYHGTGDRVEIPEGVTSIGRRAFYMCRVKSVTLPGTLTEIEQEAFACSELEQVFILGTIAKVGAGAFPLGRDGLNQCIFSGIPITAFSKAEQEYAAAYFLKNSTGIPPHIKEKNTDFAARNLLHLLSSKDIQDALKSNPELLDLIVRSGKIPEKDMDALIQQTSRDHFTELTALLLSCKGAYNQGSFDLPASPEPSTADWRKKYRFKYVDGGIEITGCVDESDEIIVPDRIGARTVETIGRHAFDGHFLPDRDSFEKHLDRKRTIVLPDSIKCIRKGAFYCINNREIFLPESLKEVPSGMLVAVNHVVLHIPKSVAGVPEDLAWDSPEKAIEIRR